MHTSTQVLVLVVILFLARRFTSPPGLSLSQASAVPQTEPFRSFCGMECWLQAK